MMKLHNVFYKVDKDFKDNIENREKTMWLFSNNADVRKIGISLSRCPKLAEFR